MLALSSLDGTDEYMIFDNGVPVVACEKCSAPLVINASVQGPLWSCSGCDWNGESESTNTLGFVTRDLLMSDSEYQTREVYGYFGTTLLSANVLEHGLINFITLLENQKKENATQQTWDDFFSKNARLTLGQLIGKLQNKIDLGSELSEALSTTLEMRNYLAHHYFRERALHLATFASREFMMEELSRASTHFESTDLLLTKVRKQLTGL